MIHPLLIIVLAVACISVGIVRIGSWVIARHEQEQTRVLLQQVYAACAIAESGAEVSSPVAAQGLRQHYGVAARQISLSHVAAEQSAQKYRTEFHHPDFGPGWQRAGQTVLQQLQRAQEKPAC